MRSVVNVATGRYVRGQERLTEWLSANGENDYFIWRDQLPPGCPAHSEVPYAFKAYALRAAIASGAKTLLWCDAAVVPVKPLDELWARIERDGYWISDQAGPAGDKGWSNYEWTADAAYPDLFPERTWQAAGTSAMAIARDDNRKIPHVVATTFGVSSAHPTGRAIFEEYFRLASTTKAFCGPWSNMEGSPADWNNERSAPCGPLDVRGHRHDQTALSVIAWRLGCKLTRWPDPFAYRGHEDERTILVADSRY